MKTRILPIAGLLTFVAVFAAFSLPGPASSAAAEAGGITVQGTASVASVLDRERLAAAAADPLLLATNAAEMRRVIAAVKAAGGTDVKTQSVSLSPRYDEQNAVQAFVATNTISATVNRLSGMLY